MIFSRTELIGMWMHNIKVLNELIASVKTMPWKARRATQGDCTKFKQACLDEIEYWKYMIRHPEEVVGNEVK
ncbi:MAG: hypothetical protein JHC33_02330 [Ignisphaera sp.]|nr:hypothetical protein [Ignisphaera sp.]